MSEKRKEYEMMSYEMLSEANLKSARLIRDAIGLNRHKSSMTHRQITLLLQAVDLLAPQEMSEPTCVWQEDENGTWETGCGRLFEFHDAGPGENGFAHCPFCGKRIEEMERQ